MLAELARQRIGVLGYGREGRAFIDALLTRHPGADVTVFDEKEVEALPDRQSVRATAFQARFFRLAPKTADLPSPALESPSHKETARVGGAFQGRRVARMSLETGPFLPERLKDFQILIRSPGIPVSHPALVQSGVEILNPSTVWFAERPEARVVAVTGSKGKSTTSALLAHLARHCGVDTVLAGNIGDPLIGHLDTSADLFVVELSSYQLADLQGRPALGLITRLFPEHLDWHGGEAAYVEAKLRLVELLDGNPLIINAADPVLRETTGGAPECISVNLKSGLHGTSEGLFDGGRRLLPARELPLVGAHNAGNIALALAAGERLGLDRAEMLKALADFRPLPHRLEVLTDSNGGRWINDSIATSPHATRAALEALQGEDVILIAGGLDRGADWSVAFEWLAEHPLRALITLPDNGARIATEAESQEAALAGGIHSSGDLAAAVDLARGLAGENTVVLLSPGAPSFPHFRDFEHRGETFRQLVLNTEN